MILKMKKILVEMDILFFGGSEKQFRNIISELGNSKECETHVLIENQTLIKDKKAVGSFIESNKSVLFHFINSNAMKYNHSIKMIRYVTKSISVIRLIIWHLFVFPRLHIDIAMVNNMTGLFISPLLRFAGCRVVYNERNTGRQVTDRNYKLKLLAKCDKIIANSKAGAQYLASVTGKNVDIYYNGIYIEDKLVKDKRNDVFRILLPGRINPVKNQMYVLEALNQLHDLKYLLILAGEDEDVAYKKKILDFVKNNGLDARVKLLGFVSDMKLEYKKADLVILPSIEEGMPNVLLESYMYGRLALCSNIEQNVDCTIEQSALFPLGDCERLVEILRATINGTYFMNPDKIIERNYEYVKNNFCMDRMARAYRKLFLEEM